ncbi:MAG: hypothetical protein U0R17_00440 [Acidimicrobiia bacterium]
MLDSFRDRFAKSRALAELKRRGIFINGNCDIDPSASIEDTCKLDSVIIGKGCELRNSVYIRHANIGSGSRIGYHTTINGTKDNPVTIPAGTVLEAGTRIEPESGLNFYDLEDGEYAYFVQTISGYRPVAMLGGKQYLGDFVRPGENFESAISDLLKSKGRIFHPTAIAGRAV